MSRTTFKTNPVGLEDLLKECHSGKLQLPDFQRSWVWAEDRILSLIASVSRAFPIGALMTLASRPGREEVFASRIIEGAPTAAKETAPEHLLLDGQQRMTSLYQACMRRDVVTTITPKNKLVRRWFYIDIQKVLDPDIDRDDAITAVPEDRKIKANFDKTIVLDLSKPEFEYEHFMFPLNQVFDWDAWQEGFGDYWIGRGHADHREIFKAFKNDVLQSFKSYQVPVIALDHDTSHEAVCLVFEKVNTGGKALDAFELLTAMYAARGHRLRDDWFGTDEHLGMHSRLAIYGHAGSRKFGVLEKVASTEVLQAIALLHTKRIRLDRAAEGAKDSDLPAVRATRQSLLDLPLEAYLAYRDRVEEGYKRAAKFLRQQYIHRPWDLPYQTQLVPLAAIFADLGAAAEHAGTLEKVSRWYWCGIFGELYGSAVESRFAKDVMEVPDWIRGGAEPTTVRDGVFRADRLNTMRTRLSAAYKGVNALLMREGSRDFRTGQTFDMTVFFDEDVDIHHIFPKAWCEAKKIPAAVYDTVINKTPLAYRTNRIIGGVAPSHYLEKLQHGKTDAKGAVVDPPLERAALDAYLRTHRIEPELLRADDFEAFMQSRRSALLALISEATGHAVSGATDTADDGVELTTEMARDSDLYLEEEVAE
jgi:hypothetical protein